MDRAAGSEKEVKKVIVSTTINPPTEAIKLFDNMPDWYLIVVGDKKTPANYKLKRGKYFSPQEQEEYDKKLSDLIGWNCIQRRNIGYLLAKDMGADVIATVDDDNIPLHNWGKNLLLGKEVKVNYYEIKDGYFDPIGLTNYPHLWHRGFPIQFVSSRDYRSVMRKTFVADIQANFWNGDPDIDAICRMIFSPECEFKNKYFPFASNKVSPFNSQNTFLSVRVLKDYFLFPFIGRMDDIWGSFYSLGKGHKVIYDKATVYQQRNVHDLTKDMVGEYLGYENNHKIVKEIKSDPDSLFKYLPSQSLKAFERYRSHFK